MELLHGSGALTWKHIDADEKVFIEFEFIYMTLRRRNQEQYIRLETGEFFFILHAMFP